jgi:hypothetical protein
MPFVLALQTEPSAGSTSSELHRLLGTDEEHGLSLRDLATTSARQNREARCPRHDCSQHERPAADVRMPKQCEGLDRQKAGTSSPVSQTNSKIDLAALAIGGMPEEKARLRRGRAAAAARRRNVAARQERRLEARLAERQASWEPSRGGPAARFPRSLGDRILHAMEPGEGYGVRDLAELLGVNYRSVQPWLYGAGNCRGLRVLVEKCRNRDLVRSLSRWEHMSGMECEPQFLWRLTRAGEHARAVILLLE